MIFCVQSKMVHASHEELAYFSRAGLTRPDPLTYARTPRRALAKYDETRRKAGMKPRKLSYARHGPHSKRLDPFLLRGDEIKGGHITIEKSPQYTQYVSSRRTARLLRQIMPSVQLVMILRDPVKRAYSAFQHFCKWTATARCTPDP